MLVCIKLFIKGLQLVNQRFPEVKSGIARQLHPGGVKGISTLSRTDCIPTKLANLKKEMSTDQKTLYHSCRAVIDGKWTTGLELGTLGPLNHARWITLALRLNFLYMSTADPSEEIQRLAWFVVTIYASLSHYGHLQESVI